MPATGNPSGPTPPDVPAVVPGSGALPTGTVTLLFTDIEGSTRLSQRVGEAAYSDLLEAHRRLLRAAISAHGGREFGTEGDALFAVFTGASDAVAAAIDGQRSLAGHDWPAEGRVAVRIGVHTGVVAASGDGYVGIALHRVARITSAGHGGQILVSRPALDAMGAALPGGAEVVELGPHRLKDFDEPELLFGVIGSGLRREFPALRAPEARPSSLPRQLTSFVGREHALAEARELLSRSRCLTLTGPGGAGKTRIAIRLAEELAGTFDAVHFVPLEPIRDPALVVSVIAGVLGVVPSGGAPIDGVIDALREHPVLIVLDTFEHVARAAPVVSDLLRSAPLVRVIVTSRSPLHIAGEQEYAIPALGLPDLGASAAVGLGTDAASLDELARVESVALFIDRATAVRPEFRLTAANAAVVAEICARLDGLPLAIELAAARVRLLTPEAILAKLGHRLALLGAGSRDVPERQQTLRAAIAWSHDLLEPAQRVLFARLSVFAGGFTLASAQAVTDPAGDLGSASGGDVLDGLAALVDQSLVTPIVVGPQTRYVMLETIREFAAEQLAASGDQDELRRRHAEHFLDVAEGAAPELTLADRARQLDELETEHDNLRAAIGWAIEAGRADVAGRFLAALWRFWQSRSHLSEGVARATSILTLADEMPPALRARAHEAAGGLAWWAGDMASVAREYAMALDIAREIGEPRLLADALYNSSFVASLDRSTALAAAAVIEEAADLYRSLGDDIGLARAMWALGINSQYYGGDYERARVTLTEAVPLARRVGDAFLTGWALRALGSAELFTGHVDAALGHLREALVIMRDAGETSGLVVVLDDIAHHAALAGDEVRAARLQGAARALEEVTGSRLGSVTWDLDPDRSPPAPRFLTPADVARYAAEGHALGLEAAIALALADPNGEAR